MFKWEVKTHQAQNAIYIEKEVEGKGRFFRARFLQAGLVNYSFGICLLNQESIMKFAESFVGCPVVIDHKDVTEESAKDDRVGVISKVDFDNYDGWFWCEGIIFDDKAIELVQNGYNVSCQYEITEYAKNIDGKLHNGNKYDIEILNGRPEHLAIVENPRYENAMIAVNAICANGGKGSGNFNHEGREGKVGGSGEGKPKSFYNEKTKTVELTGEELGKTDEEIRTNALNYYKKNLQGKKFDNPELKNILFSNPGFKKLNSNSADISKLKAIPALIDIVEKGKYIGEEELKHEREDGIIKFHRINQNVKVSENTENMSILIGEDRNGNRFYNLNNKTYISKNSSRGNHAKGETDEEFYINIITDTDKNFNPNITKNKDVDTLKGANEMEKTNELLEKIFNLFAKNEADKKEDEKEAENKCKNEDTDKRKLIDEVGGILKGKVDEEVWRTIIGKIEKVAYSKSEAGTADNKAKNEEKEDDKKCDKEAENKAKNEDSEKEEKYAELKEEIKKDIENEKAKNSLDDARRKIYGGKVEKVSTHITQKQALELGKKLY